MYKNAKLGFLAVAFLLNLFSCGKDEAVVPGEGGSSLGLQFSRNPAKLYNEVKLTFKVADNAEVEKVAFYIGEQLLGEKSDPPFEILWNTREVEDGNYQIKVVVYDSQGKEKEERQEVRVQNTLLIVHVADGHLINNESRKMDTWIFLSDQNGAMIGELQQLKNGARLVWPRPADFNSDTIYFTQLAYEGDFSFPSSPIEYLRVHTFSSFTMDELVYKKTEFPTWPLLTKWAYAVVENNFDGQEMYQYLTTTPYIDRRQNNSANTVNLGEIRLNGQSETVLNSYTRYYDQPGKREKYYRLDELFNGSSYKFHTREYTPMKEVVLPLAFNYSAFGYEVKGYLSPEDSRGYRVDYNGFTSENNKPGKAKLFYADEFPELYTSFYAAIEPNKKVWHSIKGLPSKDYTLPDFSSSVKQPDAKHLQVTTRGSFDIGDVSKRYKGKEGGYGVFENTRSFHFNNQSGVTYTIPEIPASLLELYPELNNPEESSVVHMVDMKRLETYEDNIKYRLSKDYYNTEREEFSAITLEDAIEGGRIKATQTPLLEEDQFEKERLRALGIF